MKRILLILIKSRLNAIAAQIRRYSFRFLFFFHFFPLCSDVIHLICYVHCILFKYLSVRCIFTCELNAFHMELSKRCIFFVFVCKLRYIACCMCILCIRMIILRIFQLQIYSIPGNARNPYIWNKFSDCITLWMCLQHM